MKVAVIIPTYNRATCVTRAIDSVLAQTVTCDEIIVVDDGSTDNTDEVLASYGNKITVIKQDNQGVSAARNTGIKAAHGEWIAFLDSDDTWRERKIELQLAAIDMYPEAVLIATGWAWEDEPNRCMLSAGICEGGKATLYRQPLELLLRFAKNGIWLPTWVVRRELITRIGGFDTSFHVAEDNKVMFRLATEGAFAVVPENLVLRSATRDNAKLSLNGDAKFDAELCRREIELLYEAHCRAFDESRYVKRKLRRLLAYFLRRDAERLALEKRARDARQRALESLVMKPNWRDMIADVAIVVWPTISRLRQTRWSNHK